MHMIESEIAQYLNRIQVDGCELDIAGLTKLQEHHMENIPFENLDIVVGRKISLEIDHLFGKMILKNRGGYCFELNTLYAHLLTSLGFDPKPVLGRVWISNPRYLPPRNHLAHIVTIAGKTYITDVGFGGLITRIPLDINIPTAVNDGDGLVRVIPFKEDQYMIQRESDKGWMNQYSFENVEISTEDIDISNYYMSTNPKSHFYKHRFVGKNTKEGRTGLFNNKIAFRKGLKIINKKRVEFGEEWLNIVKNDFCVDLDFTDQEIERLFDNNL